jgi:hypothetical protein
LLNLHRRARRLKWAIIRFIADWLDGRMPDELRNYLPHKNLMFIKGMPKPKATFVYDLRLLRFKDDEAEMLVWLRKNMIGRWHWTHKDRLLEADGLSLLSSSLDDLSTMSLVIWLEDPDDIMLFKLSWIERTKQVQNENG